MTEPQSIEDKQEHIDAIFASEDASQCFQLVNLSWSQPDCFSPNFSSSDVDSSFVVTLGAGVSQALYGDTGMVQAKENGGDACSAVTNRYFTEDAIAYVERGKQVFAALVCAGAFSEVELPGDGETVDYLTTLDGVTLPSGYTFEEASISASGTGDSVVYETRLLMTVDTNRKSFSLFRHQPSANQGHVIAIETVNGDSLQQQNNLVSGQTTVGVSVIFDGPDSEDDEDQTLQAELYKGTWKSTNHPGDYITAAGKIDYDSIASSLGSNNDGADNFVYTKFTNNPEASTGTVSEGITLWTASLSDYYWRAFSFNVSRDSDGGDTIKSTFGYAKLYDQSSSTYAIAAAPVGMFCAWAQQNQTGTGTGSNLSGGGLQGGAMDLVQYQVASRASGSETFVSNSSASGLSYTIGANDCGTNDLKQATSTGSITGVYDIPDIDAVSALGGLSNIGSNDVDLGL